MFITTIGYIAAILTTSSFVPQALKIIKTKDTSAISFAMYSLVSLGMLLWLFYGILLIEWPIIIANGISFVLTFIILMMKRIHR